jgi:hypothetical protein
MMEPKVVSFRIIYWTDLLEISIPSLCLRFKHFTSSVVIKSYHFICRHETRPKNRSNFRQHSCTKLIYPPAVSPNIVQHLHERQSASSILFTKRRFLQAKSKTQNEALRQVVTEN